MHHSVIVTDKGYRDLSPLQFGYEDCAPDQDFGPAVRTHWLIHFIVSGKGRFKLNHKEYTVGENDIFVIPPYVETYYQSGADTPWEYIWIGFAADEGVLPPLADVLHVPELRKIFLSMKDCEKHEASRSAFLTSKLWEMLTVLQKEQVHTADYVDTALSYIHAEYANNVTVDGIAARLNLERTYFSTLFKKRTGLSPKQYLLKHRMENAAALMRENKSSVSVAAASVGYTDIFNFSKMFKKHFGVSPSEYSKSFR